MSFAYHNKYGLKGAMQHQYDNTISKNNESISERRLHRACQHVNQYWFPINQVLLKKIREGLELGHYDLDISFLIAELKTDLSLLLYSVRETLSYLRKNSKNLPVNASLVTIFELAGLNVIKKILSECKEQASSHDLESISEEQALRIQEAMISASTAEVVSENFNLDPELSFSCAIVRQLGHILIAWNYADIYKRCLNNVSANKNLDQLLSNALGFSPRLLAMALLSEWGLDGDLNSILKENKTEHNVNLQNLTKLCEIGEALARANDPEHNPNASSDWESVKEELQVTVGANGIKTIQERVKKNSENYIKLFPEMFHNAENINPDNHIHDFSETQLLANNQFVKHCPPRLRKKLKNFYAIIKPGIIIKEALSMLVKEIIPFAGFNGGYIYTYDPSLGQLFPRTKIGSSVIRDMQAVTYDKDNASTDTIATAFSCSTPLVNNQETYFVSSITGSIGNASKIGVLYLELHPESLIENDFNLLLHFKAIRQALNDCFQV